MPYATKTSYSKREAYPTWLICHPQRSNLTSPVGDRNGKSHMVAQMNTNAETNYHTDIGRIAPNPLYRPRYQTDTKWSTLRRCQEKYPEPELNNKERSQTQPESFLSGYLKIVQSWFCLKMKPPAEIQVQQCRHSQSNNMNQYWRTKLNGPDAGNGDSVVTTVESAKDINAWSKLFNENNTKQDIQITAVIPENSFNFSEAMQVQSGHTLRRKIHTKLEKMEHQNVSNNSKDIYVNRRYPSRSLSMNASSYHTQKNYESRNPSKKFSESNYLTRVPTRKDKRKPCKNYFLSSTGISKNNKSCNSWRTQKLDVSTEYLPQSAKRKPNSRHYVNTTDSVIRKKSRTMTSQKERLDVGTRKDNNYYTNKIFPESRKSVHNQMTTDVVKYEDKSTSVQQFKRYVSKKTSVQYFEKINSNGGSPENMCVQSDKHQNNKNTPARQCQCLNIWNGNPENRLYHINNANCEIHKTSVNGSKNESIIRTCDDQIYKDNYSVDTMNLPKLNIIQNKHNIEFNKKTKLFNKQKPPGYDEDRAMKNFLLKDDEDDTRFDKLKLNFKKEQTVLDTLRKRIQHKGKCVLKLFNKQKPPGNNEDEAMKNFLLEDNEEDIRFFKLEQKLKEKQTVLDSLRKRIQYEAKDVCHTLTKIQVLEKQEQELNSKQEKNRKKSFKGVLEKIEKQHSRQPIVKVEPNYDALLAMYNLVVEECNVFNGIYEELHKQKPKIDKLRHTKSDPKLEVQPVNRETETPSKVE